VKHVGLSQVSVAELEAARRHVSVVSVQNLFNLTDRTSDDLLAHCEAEGIGFIPWFPVASGELSGPDTAMGTVVADTGATPTQVALAWLLHRSPVMLPIPGTKSVAHVEENCESATLQLNDDQMAALDAVHAAS
jgi:aryl-alcohol dehydrogenase-like predicted oxidoreductase